MSFDPEVFGEGFHRFVQLEYDLFGILSIFFHIVSFLIIFLVCKYGNKYRKFFIIYFAFNWVFLFGYWGIYGLVYWSRIGIIYLLVYIITPVLLALILYNWVKELLNPQINLNFNKTKKYRFLIFIILVWGFWYPTYLYGRGFIFELKDLLFSYYGLMPCPTTMVVLSLMTLNYPSGNKTLYNLLTTYALFIGTATALSGWLPDIPFIVLGIYALVLVLLNKDKKKKFNVV